MAVPGTDGLVVEKVDVPQWLVKVVRNLEGKKVVSVEGGVGTSRETSCFFVFCFYEKIN